VVLLTEELVPFPNMPASLMQDQVDYIVQVDSVGDPAKISVGAARVTSNPRELMIARYAADVIEHSGYFRTVFRCRPAPARRPPPAPALWKRRWSAAA
jgi:citrate lyase subunit alpha/citrate CoA-transferase